MHLQAQLGRICQRLGDYDSSQRYYRAGLELATELTDADKLCACRQGLGAVAYSQGDFREALTHYTCVWA